MEMRTSRAVLLLTLHWVIVTLGCASTNQTDGKSPRLIDRLTFKKSKTDEEVPRAWEWAPLVTTEGTRAELLSAQIPPEAVAHFLPEIQNDSVQLVSGFPIETSITHVGGRPVRSYADLLGSRPVRASDRRTQIDFRLTGARAESKPQALMLSDDMIDAILQSMHSQHSVVRYKDAENDWVYIRSGREAYKLTLRYERSTGLLHLVMAVKNCWGPPLAMPLDVEVWGPGQEPLRCLTVADVLEVTHGDPDSVAAKSGFTHYAHAAEREDYVLPTNYKRLASKEQEQSTALRMPAFAYLDGASYPGSPVLGDARILAALFMRPSLRDSREPKQMGWMVFRGAPNAEGDFLVRIQTHSGPVDVRFSEIESPKQ